MNATSQLSSRLLTMPDNRDCQNVGWSEDEGGGEQVRDMVGVAERVEVEERGLTACVDCIPVGREAVGSTVGVETSTIPLVAVRSLVRVTVRSLEDNTVPSSLP